MAPSHRHSRSAGVALASLALLHGVSAQWNDQPPANDSATNPWWPHYPDGTSKDDFMLQDTSNDDDLTGKSRVATWIITASNAFRAQFGSQNVQWNESCAREAQRHVDTCLWEHWGSDNLAEQSYSEADGRFDINSMMELWSSEWDYYPFRYPSAQANSHFTAMVWNDSTTVGCAWNVGCSNDTKFPSQTFFVCNYWPVGNMNTQPPGKLYAQNVGNFTKWSEQQVPTITPDQVPSSGNAPTVQEPGTSSGSSGDGSSASSDGGSGGSSADAASGTQGGSGSAAAPSASRYAYSGAGSVAASITLLAVAGFVAVLA